jgi:hypothetical protein
MCRIPFCISAGEGTVGTDSKRVLDRAREKHGLPRSMSLDEVRDRLLAGISDSGSGYVRPVRRHRSVSGDDAEGSDPSDFSSADGGC